MEELKLEVSSRETGSTAAKQMRKEGFVPGVLYGFDQDPVHFKVKETDLHPLIYSRQLHQVEVSLNGDTWECILKEVDYHPVTDHPRHVDFQVLHPDRQIKTRVPFTFRGVSEGEERGGELVKVLNDVLVEALPKNVPSKIEVEVTELDIGDSIHIDNLSIPGVRFLVEPSQTVCTVVGARLEVLEAEEEEEEAEELEGAEGEVPPEEAEELPEGEEGAPPPPPEED